MSSDVDPVSLPPSTLSQPIPLDATGDLTIDLLGTSSNSRDFSLWKNVWNESQEDSAVFEVYVPRRTIRREISEYPTA